MFQVRSGDAGRRARAPTRSSPASGSTARGARAGGATTSRCTGPNGFFRGFQGGTGRGRARLDVVTEDRGDDIRVTITNPTNDRVTARVTDAYSGRHNDRQLHARSTWTATWSTGRVFGWYDLTVTTGSDDGFAYRLAGHVEDGRDSASDPGMGGLFS